MKPAFFITTMLIVSAALSAQRYSDQICGEVIQIDSATYYQTEQHGTYWDTVTAPIQKINHTILVVTKDSTYSFTDQWEDQIEDYLPNYYYLGRWKEWVLIMEEDLHRQFYYAINLKENRIDRKSVV